ncbi:DUF29 domain-containing protein [Paraburkholderia strydomiana]|uniref:DUF29 domain-containing protein n=1 Tax=Paraburkholderia strydomiana TaxID=1245417 RepID=UPI0038BD16E0
MWISRFRQWRHDQRTFTVTDYNADFVLWAEEQAAMLRAGRVTELDRENLAEELESLARALRRELTDRIARLLQNLVQWDYLPGVRLPAWYVAITEERGMIPAILKDAPSLRANWSAIVVDAWQEARGRASGATGLSDRIFPESCPYTPSQALDSAFWPGEWNNKQEGPTHSVWPSDGLEYQQRIRAEWDEPNEPKDNQ